MNKEDISFKEKAKLITSELMYKDLEENEIVTILSKYFYNIEESHNYIYKIFVRGLKYSYESEYPMQTAGVFYRNSIKVAPKVYFIFSNRLVKTFKNMIMRKSSTGIKIESYEDFCDISTQFEIFFQIEPPNHNSILEAIVEDEDSIRKITEDFSYYKIIEDIFSHSNHQCLESLDNRLVLELKEQLSKLKVDRAFIIDEDRIEFVNLRILQIEEKIEHITLNK